MSLSLEAPTSSSTLAESFHTWNVGIALIPHEAATACNEMDVKSELVSIYLIYRRCGLSEKRAASLHPSNYLNLVNINLEEYNAGKLSAELLKLGRYHPARPTPGSGEVDHDLQAQFDK